MSQATFFFPSSRTKIGILHSRIAGPASFLHARSTHTRTNRRCTSAPVSALGLTELSAGELQTSATCCSILARTRHKCSIIGSRTHAVLDMHQGIVSENFQFLGGLWAGPVHHVWDYGGARPGWCWLLNFWLWKPSSSLNYEPRDDMFDWTTRGVELECALDNFASIISTIAPSIYRCANE